MDLVRLAYYPFLPEVKEAARTTLPDLRALLESPLYGPVRQRARERVEGSLQDGFAPAAVADTRTAALELASIPVARMMLVALGERMLFARYAAAEAQLVRQRLLAESDDEAVSTAAAALGLAADAVEGAWRLHFSEYLRLAPAEASWKLLLRPVAAGHVVIQKPDMVRLVEEALKRRITDELEAERSKPLPAMATAALAPHLAALQPKLEEAREAWSQGDFGPVQPELFPPCIKELFETMRRNENVPHHGRFAFATFLHTVGWNAEQIMDYLSATPNFDREKSRYQIEHVTGGKGVAAYTPPGCATMQTNGVCPLAKRDAVCFTIKHPLNYYRKQLRFRQQAEGKASVAGKAPSIEPPMKPMKPIPATEAKP